jgi:hypothetical protein
VAPYGCEVSYIRGLISVGVNATLEVISVVWISEPLLANKHRGGLALQQLSGFIDGEPSGRPRPRRKRPKSERPRAAPTRPESDASSRSVTCVDRGQRSK